MVLTVSQKPTVTFSGMSWAGYKTQSLLIIKLDALTLKK
jgi:hypothetical protein